MVEEIPFIYGAFYCTECQRVYYYRGLLPDFADYEVFRCPECNQELREIVPNTFIDSTDETLSILDQLEQELGEG